MTSRPDSRIYTVVQSAAIYQLKDRMLIHPWQRTTMGLGIASEPYVSLPLDADANALGDAVLNALSLSGRTVPHPTAWKGLGAARLKAAGVKSEKAFQLGARSLTAEREAQGFRIEPSRNGGTKGDAKGFAPLPELGMSLPPTSNAEALGAAIRACLERCA
jgi:hypothetical protein